MHTCAHHCTCNTRQPRKRYGFFKFMIDLILVFLTGGVWLLWIFIREMRRR